MPQSKTMADHIDAMTAVMKRLFLRQNRNPPPPRTNKIPEVPVPAPGRKVHPAEELETRLWGGFSEQALEDLLRLKSNPETPADVVQDAAIALARWHASHGNFHAALQESLAARSAGNHENFKQQLLEATCLLRLGKPSEARGILIRAAGEMEPSSCTLIAGMANSFASQDGAISEEDEKLRLQWINRLFENHGIAPVQRHDPSLPLSLDNLVSPAAVRILPCDCPMKVSVLVPAFNAEKTLPCALRSLQTQTWQNLEILVVDDGSSDQTYALAQEHAAKDPRIAVLLLTENSGTYAARNDALLRASGEFVTVHDADDWSHPQKIERQIRYLIEHPEVPANFTQWIRCFNHLYFKSPNRFAWDWLLPNLSSLMIRRETLLQLGGWDDVRVGADSDLLRRLEKSFGGNIPKVLDQVPMSFALDSPDSLTRHQTTGVRTMFYGVRKNYHDASRYWLKTEGEANQSLTPAGAHRAFPAPDSIHRRKQARSVDLLFIMDFHMAGGACVSTMNYIHAALDMGLRVSVFQWRRYDLKAGRSLPENILEMAQKGLITILAPGENISAKTVIAGYPVILRYKIDLPPSIQCERFLIITNQMCARFHNGDDAQYDPESVSENVQTLFGIRPHWIPISELVRGLMVRDGRYKPIHEKTWTPLVGPQWLESPVTWRGGPGRPPVVGRHSRDACTKWPESAQAIRDAFCADKPCEVRLLGGAKFALGILGAKPDNWHVMPFNSMDPRSFLGDLDFFVHFTHEDYIEEFGRAILEAMAMGIPVILPGSFRATFGEAAIYSEPKNVWPVICELWADEKSWRLRSEAGKAFVRGNSGWDQFASRLTDLPPAQESDDRDFLSLPSDLQDRQILPIP